jgi:hypothetical protein
VWPAAQPPLLPPRLNPDPNLAHAPFAAFSCVAGPFVDGVQVCNCKGLEAKGLKCPADKPYCTCGACLRRNLLVAE